MPDSPLPFAPASQKLRGAKSILIVLPDFYTYDMAAAALALSRSLEADKGLIEGKRLTLACGQPLAGASAELEGADRVQTTIGSRNLVISLGIDQEQIEKVSYDSGNGEFNLIIETKDGAKRLDESDVRYSYRGADADLIMGIGVTSSEQISSLLKDEPDMFQKVDSLVFSALPTPATVGTIQLINPEASSVSEMITGFIRYLKAPVDAVTASQLLGAIEQTTNQFMLKTGADTFAAASFLLKSGATRRLAMTPSPMQPSRPFNPLNQPTMPFPPAGPTPLASVPPSPFPRPTPPPPPTRPRMTNPQTQDDTEAPSQDWLEPKIFRGGKNV